jgi:hypothetical protein
LTGAIGGSGREPYVAGTNLQCTNQKESGLELHRSTRSDRRGPSGCARQANLAAALRAAGAGLTDVVKRTIYVACSRREDLVTASEVLRSQFGDHDALSTVLGVGILGYPDQLVEVDAIATLR